MRETLFNWCTAALPDASCLDLFAGSGVLGFEAVSRGARRAVLVEADRATCDALRALQARLQTDRISVHEQDALAYLAGAPEPFDLVFLDPPFRAGLSARVLDALCDGWLAENALVYLELPRSADEPDTRWRTLRRGQTQQVSYRLMQRVG